MKELPNTVVFLQTKEEREEYQKMCDGAAWTKSILNRNILDTGNDMEPIYVEVEDIK